jgi:hypothetical protein
MPAPDEGDDAQSNVIWQSPRVINKLMLGVSVGILRMLLALFLLGAHWVVSDQPLLPLLGEFPSYGVIFCVGHLGIGLVGIGTVFVEDVVGQMAVLGLHVGQLVLDAYSVGNLSAWIVMYSLGLLKTATLRAQMSTSVAIFDTILTLVLLALTLLACGAYLYVITTVQRHRDMVRTKRRKNAPKRKEELMEQLVEEVVRPVIPMNPDMAGLDKRRV